MPRFLNTWTGEFEWHPDPTQVTYAILSHVWREPQEGGEQSYDDVRRIQQEVRENRWVPASLDSDTGVCSDTSMAWAPFAFISFEDIKSTEYGTIFTHPGLSDKIKGFCQVAREAGFRLAWNDACCIDKTSSAELSEAINSMYEWYRLSDMCYVYLSDVPNSDGPQDTQDTLSRFRCSKWHRRGWTLQELIAPEHIIFLTETWNVLGTKIGLAMTLERITGVDFDILVGRATLDSVSVARRMSWTAERETTRVEDRAYSLLGIFGLHMSPIYGEGENAFLRLQEEIIRTIPDQSIFAWGDPCTFRLPHKGEWSLEACGFSAIDEHGHGLLTSSPASFSYCSNLESTASSSLAQILGIDESQIPPVNCIFTPEGVGMRLICLPLSGVPDIRKAFQEQRFTQDTCERCKNLDRYDTLALLQCQARYTTSIFALPLFRSRQDVGRSNRRAFHIGGHMHEDRRSWTYHTVRIEIGGLVEVLKHVRPTVENVTLLRHYSDPPVPKSLQRDDAIPHAIIYLCSSSLLHDIVFEISPYSIDVLGKLGIDPTPLKAAHFEESIRLSTILAFRSDSWSGTSQGIALGLSLTERPDSQVEICFLVMGRGVIVSRSGQSSSIGASTAASHHVFVDTSSTSGGFLDLDSHNDICRTITLFKLVEIWRPTIFCAEYTVHSKAMWGGAARLMRIALQRTFACLHTKYEPPSYIWLSIDISEVFPYASRTESGLDSISSEQTGTDVWERDSETSNEHDNIFPSRESTPLPVSADQEDAVDASRDMIEDLRQKNGVQPARTTAVTHNTASILSPPSPACGGSGWDASSVSSGSIDGPPHSEPTRSSAEPGQRADHESLGNTGAEHAREDVCEDLPCRGEDATLREEIEQLKKRNAELSSELAAVSSQNGVLALQMANLCARLDALTTSPAVNAG